MKQNQPEQQPAEGVTVTRKRRYAVLAAACALVLAAAVALTIAFTVGGNEPAVPTPGPSVEAPADDEKPPVSAEDPDDLPTGGGDDEPVDAGTVLALPVANAAVNTSFEFWYNATLDRYHLHTGIDFSAPAGTQVTAAAAGTVESITDNILEGGRIVIDHGDGLKTVYASVDAASALRVGDSVAKGDVLGAVSSETETMGNEYDEGPHLHFEVWKGGAAVDPAGYLDLEEK